MVLIITYDLRTPKDYHEFYEAIKSQGEQGKWWHYMTSTWLLSTTKTPQEVFAHIQPHLSDQDFLFICELSKNYQGWLPKQAWDWINAELGTRTYASMYGLSMPPVPGPGIAPPPPPPNPFLGERKIGKLSDLVFPPKKPGER